MDTPIFTKFGQKDVRPIMRPCIEGGHHWSMWLWLSTTNPNLHTFSLFHYQCASHYSEYHSIDIGMCPHFCPEPIILWGQLPWALRCAGFQTRGRLGPRS